MRTPDPKRCYPFTSQRDVPWPSTPATDWQRQRQQGTSTPAEQQAAIDKAFERLYRKLDERGEEK